MKATDVTQHSLEISSVRIFHLFLSSPFIRMRTTPTFPLNIREAGKAAVAHKRL